MKNFIIFYQLLLLKFLTLFFSLLFTLPITKPFIKLRLQNDDFDFNLKLKRRTI